MFLNPIKIRHFLILFVLCLGFLSHTYIFNLDLIIASSGFSILEVLHAHENQEAFLRDFPGGARQTAEASPTFYLYILGKHLGLDWMFMLHSMILLEMGCLLTGGYFFFLSLARIGIAYPIKEDVFFLLYVCVAGLLIFSSIQRANVANWGFPFFHGQFYGFADGFRLLFLAMFFQQKWSHGFLFLFLAFVLHPVKALIAALASLFVFIQNYRRFFELPHLFSAALFCTCILFWINWNFSSTSTSNPILLEDFVAYTRALQSHWYPIELGFFSNDHFRGISPFLSLLLVTVVALNQSIWEEGFRLQLQVLLVFLIILTIVGLLFSVFPISQTMLQLSFLRAANLITLISAPIIVIGVYSALLDKNWVLFGGMIVFIASSFTPSLSNFTFPAVFALLLGSYHFFQVKRFDWLHTLVFSILALNVLLQTLFETSHLKFSLGASPLLIAWVLASYFFKHLETSKHQNFVRFNKIYILIALVFIGGIHFCFKSTSKVMRNEEVDSSYKAVQLWANKKTGSASLFMVDPCRWYGWRDFSGRPSLGTIREWYMTSWLYTGDVSNLELGKKISQTLGFDMEKFRNKPASAAEICDEARQLYYQPGFTAQNNLSESFGVDYFIFEHKFASNISEELKKFSVFNNEHFSVVSSKDLP